MEKKTKKIFFWVLFWSVFIFLLSVLFSLDEWRSQFFTKEGVKFAYDSFSGVCFIFSSLIILFFLEILILASYFVFLVVVIYLTFGVKGLEKMTRLIKSTFSPFGSS